MGYVNAQTIDKKKILEIIKAAKQHKSVPKIDRLKVTKKITSLKPKPIIVYRKRKTPTVRDVKLYEKKVSLMKVNYGTLPALTPSSVELRKRFHMEQKSQQKEVLFKSPQQNRNKKVNTRAIKIKYF